MREAHFFTLNICVYLEEKALNTEILNLILGVQPIKLISNTEKKTLNINV